MNPTQPGKSVLKTILVLVLVIAAEHMIHWRGQPISDHVHSLISELQAAKPFDQSKVWIKQVSKDAEAGYQRARLGKNQLLKESDRLKTDITKQAAVVAEPAADELSESASSAINIIDESLKQKQ